MKSIRHAEGLVLSASLHVLCAVALWFGYITREETAIAVRNALIIVSDVENSGSGVEQRDLPQNNPSIAASRVQSSLNQAMRDSRDRKAAQLAREAQQKQADAIRAEAVSSPPVAKKEQRTITKEQFDRQNSRTSPSPARPVTIAHVDSDTLARELRDNQSGAQNSAANAIAGDMAAAARTYLELVEGRIKAALDEHPGVGAGLVVEAEIHILLSGEVRGVRIVRPSGSADFDGAVREALTGLKLPARPASFPEVQRFPIRGVE